MYSQLDNNREQQLSILFRYAMQLTGNKEYESAARLFQFLTACNSVSFDYWLQFAKCCQALQAWTDAIYAYGRAAQLNVSEAEVHCSAGECWLASGNALYAGKAFRAALLIIGTDADNTPLRQRVEAGLSRLAEINQ